jgi:hypothetical protein
MGYRWKPNASQRKAFKERLKERDTYFTTIKSNGAIRNGCYIKYYSLSRGKIIEGTVINNSYGAGKVNIDTSSLNFSTLSKGQHTFTILTPEKEKVLVKGRNLYPNLLQHIPGEESLNLS